MINFKELKVWTHAHKLALDVHDVTESFPKSERYDTVSQLRRASKSIAANIAEGSSRRTDKDFRKFLYNSISSAS